MQEDDAGAISPVGKIGCEWTNLAGERMRSFLVLETWLQIHRDMGSSTRILLRRDGIEFFRH